MAIIQARMTSTRLPGKVMMNVLGRPILSFQLERASRVSAIDKIVIATTKNESDEPIVEFGKTKGFSVFRGSEPDVLSRYQEAATKYEADVIIRLTADCPIIDPDVISLVIKRFNEPKQHYDYVTNAIPRSYPAGLDIECFSRSALEIAANEAIDDYDREHVTPFFYRHPERFKLLSVVCEKNLAHERWTLDELPDFVLIRRIIETLYIRKPEFRMDDVIKLLDTHPDWRKINQLVKDTPRVLENKVFKGKL